LGIGLLANVAVNLTRSIFSGKSSEALNKGNPAVTAANCGDACAVTHHEVVLTMQAHGADPKDNYTVILDAVDNKVEGVDMAALGNLGLELIAKKIKLATLDVPPKPGAPESTKPELPKPTQTDLVKHQAEPATLAETADKAKPEQATTAMTKPDPDQAQAQAETAGQASPGEAKLQETRPSDAKPIDAKSSDVKPEVK
jgi:type IV secretory pathway VirB10-like protein